jgi:hypothetical protein
MLDAYMEIYNLYKNIESHDVDILLDMLRLVKERPLYMLKNWYMKCEKDGTALAELSILCGNTYLVER